MIDHTCDAFVPLPPRMVGNFNFVRLDHQAHYKLVSFPTRTFVCAVNDLYFLCDLGKHSAASLLACDGGAGAARPGLVAEKREPPRTPSIYATDTWSGRVGEAKYKRRDAK